MHRQRLQLCPRTLKKLPALPLEQSFQLQNRTLLLLYTKNKMMETLSQKLVWSLMEPVVRQTFPDETGAQRMQQVAVLLAIHALRSVSDEPVTATRIVHLFGHAESEVSRLIGRLVDRGLVHRERTTRPGFKGSVVNLTLIESDELKAIFKEIGALPKD